MDDGKYSLTFPSGLAAATALFSLLRTGDHILVCSIIYGGTVRIIRDFLTEYEVENTFISDLSDISAISEYIKSNTKVRFVYGLEIIIRWLCKLSDHLFRIAIKPVNNNH